MYTDLFGRGGGHGQEKSILPAMAGIRSASTDTGAYAYAHMLMRSYGHRVACQFRLGTS